jgi:hypothetical protein
VERVLDVDAEITDRTLYLDVAEQNLDRPQIAGCFVDYRRLRPPQRVRAVILPAQSDPGDPLVD